MAILQSVITGYHSSAHDHRVIPKSFLILRDNNSFSCQVVTIPHNLSIPFVSSQKARIPSPEGSVLVLPLRKYPPNQIYTTIAVNIPTWSKPYSISPALFVGCTYGNLTRSYDLTAFRFVQGLRLCGQVRGAAVVMHYVAVNAGVLVYMEISDASLLREIQLYICTRKTCSKELHLPFIMFYSTSTHQVTPSECRPNQPSWASDQASKAYPK